VTLHLGNPTETLQDRFNWASSGRSFSKTAGITASGMTTPGATLKVGAGRIRIDPSALVQGSRRQADIGIGFRPGGMVSPGSYTVATKNAKPRRLGPLGTLTVAPGIGGVL
jgi:hypothetical protein